MMFPLDEIKKCRSYGCAQSKPKMNTYLHHFDNTYVLTLHKNAKKKPILNITIKKRKRNNILSLLIINKLNQTLLLTD